MSEKVLAALKVGPSTTELRELDLPPIPPDAALMKVEVAGVCGTDVSQYRLPLRGGPLVMGHENVGYLARVGSAFAATTMPLRPTLAPEQATACQLWPGVPGTNVATRKLIVGTTQLTSPTSVEP